jgi:phospholipid/cholesterol/gamma-HCH transport system substrate-binding protein
MSVSAIKKKQRKAALGLFIFLLVTSVMTWLVYATLQRTVTGKTRAYGAEFTDVFGLRDGDDVRMAGVRVGRVSKVDLVGEPGDNRARVEFALQDDQQIFPNTEASILYQNIVGQRYLDLRLGPDSGGDTSTPLPEGSVIPVDRTIPSFDVGLVLNGYQPLFASIDPAAADQITKAAVQAFQGDTGAMATLVEKSGNLTETIAGRDELLGEMITGMDRLFGTLAGQNGNIEKTLNNAQQMVTTFNSRRPELVSSMGSISRVVRALGAVTTEVNPSLQALITREPGFAAHLVSIEPQLAFMGANLPKMLKGLARVSQSGAYLDVYTCDLNALGFFPGLNDVTPIIVNAATPGNQAKHTPKCRNMANG